jgi:hypothetical protein
MSDSATEFDLTFENPVNEVAKKYNVPHWIWYPIAMTESGGNPHNQTVTDSEDSRGIFQVNIFAHPDANASMLYDAKYNAEYQMPEIAKYYNEGVSKGLTDLDLLNYTAKNAQRPEWTTYYTTSLARYYDLDTGNWSYNQDAIAEKYKNDNTGGISGIIEDIKSFFFGGTKQDDSTSAVFKLEDLVKNPLGFIKYGFVQVIFFIILLFALYVVFVKNSNGETVIKKAVKKGKGAITQ